MNKFDAIVENKISFGYNVIDYKHNLKLKKLILSLNSLLKGKLHANHISNNLKFIASNVMKDDKTRKFHTPELDQLAKTDHQIKKKLEDFKTAVERYRKDMTNDGYGQVPLSNSIRELVSNVLSGK